MTTATSVFSWSNTAAVDTRTWINGVHDLIIAAGLVATTDTGQLDVSTITSTVNTSTTNLGYHAFKFPDTLQTTTPIIVKVTYYTDGLARPALRLDVGSVTNGAGTLSSPSFSLANNTNMGALQSGLTSYACYVDGTFTMVLGAGYLSGGTANNCVASLVVDRSRDATGTATATGFLAESCTTCATAASQSRSLFGAASPATNDAFIPAMIPSKTATTSSEGSNVNVFRHYMMVPGVRPSLGALTYYNAEFGALTPFTATVLGSAHVYLPMGVFVNYWSAAPVVGHCAAIRWE